MHHFTTNLSVIMGLLNISSKELSLGLHVDPSLVSRWRSGSRRLTETGDWAGELANYFLKRGQPEVRELLHTVCPLKTALDVDLKATLTKWLCEASIDKSNMHMLLANASDKTCTANCSSIYGAEGVAAARSILCEFLDYVLTLPDPKEILFVCPVGLSIFTRDSAYNLPVQEQLMLAFRRGFRLKAILRTDYRISDVALACGPWLSAHLHGFIESRYYDDFSLNEDEAMLICLPNSLAIQIIVRRGQVQTQVWKDAEHISEVQQRINTYFFKAQSRFHYNFLDSPAHFLSDTHFSQHKPIFLFQQFPFLGLLGAEDTGFLFNLTPAEQAMLHQEFSRSPLTFGIRLRLSML